MTVTVQQVLDRYARGLTENEFAEELEARLADEHRARAVSLTAAEREFLVGVGVAEQDLEPPSGIETIRNRADDLIDMAALSCTPGEAAERLGVDTSRIRHRVSDSSLYGFKLGSRLRLPLWQFTDGRPAEPLPHLRAVVTAVPDGVAPLELDTFMTTPQSDLQIGGRRVTPRDWLLAGQPPAAVCEMLDNFYQW